MRDRYKRNFQTSFNNIISRGRVFVRVLNTESKKWIEYLFNIVALTIMLNEDIDVFTFATRHTVCYAKFNR